DGACVNNYAQLCGVRVGDGLRSHPPLALRAQSSRRAGGRADAFLALSRSTTRSTAARDRDHSRRGLGELFLGPVLGLGPERNLGPDRAALLPDNPSRAIGRLVD